MTTFKNMSKKMSIWYEDKPAWYKLAFQVGVLNVGIVLVWLTMDVAGKIFGW